MNRIVILLLVSLSLVSARPAAALPPPTIPTESVPADTPPPVKQAIEQLCERNPRTQSGALERLEQAGPAASSAVPFLMSMLPQIRPGWMVLFGSDSPDDHAGYTLLHTLAAIGEPAVGPLVEALRDKNPLVRAGAAYALTMVRQSLPAAPLLAALRDPDARVREFAAEGLNHASSYSRFRSIPSRRTRNCPRRSRPGSTTSRSSTSRTSATALVSGVSRTTRAWSRSSSP